MQQKSAAEAATKAYAKVEMEKLAEEMEVYIASAPSVKVRLAAPEMLTVMIPGKGFSKVSHIGGEEFIPHGVYLGKRDKLIATFKPVDAVTYHHMEMPVDEAMTNLAGYDEFATNSCDGGYSLRIRDIRNNVQRAQELEQVAEKSAQYADLGFGSW